MAMIAFGTGTSFPFWLTHVTAPLCRPVFDRVKLSALRIRRVKSYFGRWDCTKGCFDICHPWNVYTPFLQATSSDKALMASFII